MSNYIYIVGIRLFKSFLTKELVRLEFLFTVLTFIVCVYSSLTEK
jgi:hypothetical protein